MVVVPKLRPEITPVEVPIVPTNTLELDHAPPGVASDKVAVLPKQTVKPPLIAAAVAGKGFTVTDANTDVVPQTLVAE